MKKTLVGCFVVLLLVVGSVSGRTLRAEDILPDRATEETVVVVDNPQAREDAKPAVYKLDRWIVEEETSDPVENALRVYKEKAEPKYSKRVWLTDRKSGKRRMIVEYADRDPGHRMIFSPDERFMYYLGVNPGGQSIVYGINLASNKKFALGAAQDFSTVQCSAKSHYVVIEEPGQPRSVYQVYSTQGKRVRTLTDIASPLDIEKSLCR